MSDSARPRALAKLVARGCAILDQLHHGKEFAFVEILAASDGGLTRQGARRIDVADEGAIAGLHSPDRREDFAGDGVGAFDRIEDGGVVCEFGLAVGDAGGRDGGPRIVPDRFHELGLILERGDLHLRVDRLKA